MSDDGKPDAFSLRRWSARKHAAVKEATPPPTEAPAASTSAEAVVTPAPLTPVAGATPAESAPLPKVELPTIESLTPQSDFTPFMQAGVAPALRSAALRKLFADPHFNVMDGLDVYIDDYSKPDPIPPDVVKMLRHARYIFAPPPTRVNALGHVEDVPEEERAKSTPAATTAEVPDGTAVPAAVAVEAPAQIALPLDTPNESCVEVPADAPPTDKP